MILSVLFFFFFAFLLKNIHVLLVLVVWISVFQFFLILSSKRLDMGIKILLFLGLFSRVFFHL